MASPTVWLVSRNKDFTHALAEQVREQLALDCRIAEHAGAVHSLEAPAVLVVTDQAGGDYGCPVLEVTRRPVRMMDLLADMAAALAAPAGETLALGNYVVWLRQKRLAHTGTEKDVSLTDKEVKLLQCLKAAGAKGMTREKLLKEVWGIDAALDTHTLETHMYRLRGKFRELGGDEHVIAAIEGGYRLAI